MAYKKSNKPIIIKAVAFDMDGVIFDSEKLYFDSFIISANKYGVELSEDTIKQFAGKTTRACQIMLQGYLNDVKLADKIWQDWGLESEKIARERGVPVKEGVVDLINHFVKEEIPISLVTSASMESVYRNFSHASKGLINNFSPIITLEKVTRPKPHPDPYLTAFDKLKISPDEALVIEDSVTGATAAITSGANTLMVNSDIYIEPLKDQLFFHTDNFKDVLTFVKTCSFDKTI